MTPEEKDAIRSRNSKRRANYAERRVPFLWKAGRRADARLLAVARAAEMSALLRKCEVAMVPNPDGGRIQRITLDIDMNRVQDYVFFEGMDGRPWPLVLLEEMSDLLLELASREASLRILQKD